MAESVQPNPSPAPRRNGLVVGLCLAFVGGMVGMSFAAVPLYQMFCAVTGYNGTTQRVEQMSDVVLDKTVTVSFDPNVASGLPWEFKAVTREVTMKIGETVEVDFIIQNMSDKPTVGQARFNVTPMQSAVYFNKVQCFCFERTELKPGEKRDMPVVFYIDPEIVKHAETKTVNAITLSYTFYPQEDEKPVARNVEKVKTADQL